MTSNMWFLVRPGEPGELVRFDLLDDAQRLAYIGHTDLDCGAFTRRYGYFVYAYSLLEEPERWQHNFTFTSGYDAPEMLLVVGGQVTEFTSSRVEAEVRGPCLVFKSDGTGETQNMTAADAELLNEWIAAARVGLLLDAQEFLG